MRSAPTLKIWMTPAASVAILEKFALLKMASWSAPVLRRASDALTSSTSRELVRWSACGSLCGASTRASPMRSPAAASPEAPETPAGAPCGRANSALVSCGRTVFKYTKAEPLKQAEQWESGDVAKANEPMPRVVPQCEPQRANALRERDHRDIVEERIFLVTSHERVVGDARPEVMHVVYADAAREPAKDRRQL